MALAIEEAERGMRNGEGGPFGAIIVQKGKIIGRGHNRVLCTSDPTAHAEVNAIRDACSGLGTPHLENAVIYSNFEPCPMCLSAIYWAHIDKLYYSSSREEAEEIGFQDRHIYDEIGKPLAERSIPTIRIKLPAMEELKGEWKGLGGKNLY